jgi:ribonuclease P/MRP protein subunit POP3
MDYCNFLIYAIQRSRQKPDLLDHITIGINAVTKKLEAQCRAPDALSPGFAHSLPLIVVLVCHADLQPPEIADHLPQLVASCNATAPLQENTDESSHFVQLATVPPGSETELATALGMRRASVLAFDVSSL